MMMNILVKHVWCQAVQNVSLEYISFIIFYRKYMLPICLLILQKRVRLPMYLLILLQWKCVVMLFIILTFWNDFTHYCYSKDCILPCCLLILMSRFLHNHCFICFFCWIIVFSCLINFTKKNMFPTLFIILQ